MRSASKKQFVIISSSIWALGKASEPIQVQLSLKAGQLCLTEVPRELYLSKEVVKLINKG